MKALIFSISSSVEISKKAIFSCLFSSQSTSIVGISATQGAHQVAQKFIKIVFPSNEAIFKYLPSNVFILKSKSAGVCSIGEVTLALCNPVSIIPLCKKPAISVCKPVK